MNHVLLLPGKKGQWQEADQIGDPNHRKGRVSTRVRLTR